MKNKRIVEDDFLKYAEDTDLFEEISSLDSWGEVDDSTEEIDTENIEDISFSETDIEDEDFEDEIVKALKNELLVPEYNRRYVVFTDKRTGETIKGIPMAQIGNDAFLLKVNGKLKKYKLENMKFDY